MENESLVNKIRKLNNEELIELLKLRDLYQPEAVEIGIAESLLRGIIQSEEDLKLPRFQPDERHKKSLFPHLNSASQFEKAFNSMIRILYFTAIIPLLFGILKFIEGDIVFSVTLLGLGGLWVYLSIQLQKKKHPGIPWALIVVFLLGIGSVLTKMEVSSTLELEDFIVIALAFITELYVLLYIRILTIREGKKKKITS
ncbi:MAG TPA: hypothetical protein VKA27_17875 [Sunxiuqinia sp.]|nr:hypothetical protein [Sunxiuqinia sp.]